MAQLLHLYVCHFFGGPAGHSSPDTEQQRGVFLYSAYFWLSGHNTYLNMTLNEVNNYIQQYANTLKIFWPSGQLIWPKEHKCGKQKVYRTTGGQIRGFRDLNCMGQ